MSVEILLDRFGQSSKFCKKSYKKCWNIQVWVIWRSSRGRPENVLVTSRINLPGTSLKCQIRTSPGRRFRTSREVRLGCPQHVRSWHTWDGQIGSLRDVLGTLEEDVLRTNIFRLGTRYVTFSPFILAGKAVVLAKLVISGILYSILIILALYISLLTISFLNKIYLNFNLNLLNLIG